MIASLKTQRDLRKQLLSDVSHEINTPLNAIRLEARGLSDGLVSAEVASHYIISEIDSLKNIVYDLDWLAETDSGIYALNKEAYQISKLITEEAKRWIPKAESRDLKLEVKENVEPLPAVRVDVVRISTVLGNLIDNAIKYSSAGGRIEINVLVNKSQLVISVCDNGPAIAPDHQSVIFERFYRAERSGRAEVPGRGLGLAIVKRIVELHKGRVWVECGKEYGNCFFFSLPV